MQNASEKEFGYETLAEGKTFQVVGENQFPPIFVLYSVTWVSARKIANAPNNIAKEAEKAEAEAAEYWKELEKKENIIKTPSGLAYEIIEKGSGAMPGENSEVIVNYEGKLINGNVFDSSIKRGEPAQFNLSKVIPGFREGLQKIAKGGKARLYIPAKLGYGNQPVPGIPINSTLIFEVEMIDVDPQAAAPAPSAPAAPAPEKK